MTYELSNRPVGEHVSECEFCDVSEVPTNFQDEFIFQYQFNYIHHPKPLNDTAAGWLL